MYTLHKNTTDITMLDKEEYVAIDTETDGLYGTIRIIQVYQETLEKVLIIEYPSKEFLKEILQFKLLGHNLQYDLTCIAKELGVEIDIDLEYRDTFLFSSLALPELKERKLKTLLPLMLGSDPYAGEITKTGEEHAVVWRADRELNSNDLTYASIDVYYLHKLWIFLNEKDRYSTNLSIPYAIDKKASICLISARTEGIPIDKETLENEIASAEEIVSKCPEGINLKSPSQVKRYLNSPQTDAEGLIFLDYLGDMKAGKVREIKQNFKKLEFLNTYKGESKITGSISILTKSGRTSSNGSNLQQIPRQIRNILKCDPSHVLIYADFSQQEIRILCCLSNDKTMKNVYEEGIDMHSYTASKIWSDFDINKDKDEYTKEDNERRQIGKSANFNLGYGGGAGALNSILIKQAHLVLKKPAEGIEDNAYIFIDNQAVVVGSTLDISTKDKKKLNIKGHIVLNIRNVKRKSSDAHGKYFLTLECDGESKEYPVYWKHEGRFIEASSHIVKILSKESIKQCQEIKDKWLTVWQGIKKWQIVEKRRFERSDRTTTVLGRVLHPTSINEQLNLQVQGTGAEVSKLALIHMVKNIRKEGVKAHLINFVHDSFLFSCVNDKVEYAKACEIICEAMKESWRVISLRMPIKDLVMPVEVVVGSTVSDLENKVNCVYIHKG